MSVRSIVRNYDIIHSMDANSILDSKKSETGEVSADDIPRLPFGIDRKSWIKFPNPLKENVRGIRR